MSLVSGLPGGSQKSDDLLKILNSPEKAKSLLLKIKSESEKVNKAKKELLQSKTVKQFTESKKTEAEKAVKEADAAIASIGEERKKAKAAADQTRRRLEKRESEIKSQEDKLNETAKFLAELSQALSEREHLVKRREEAAESNLKYAESVRNEYTDKIDDLKERMKGL